MADDRARRRIVWMTWKDRSHPLAGGAETVNEALAGRLAADGHEVTMLVGGFPGAAHEEARDGYRIVRLGNRVTVYWRAWRHYRRHLRGKTDLVIDEVNTVPFFARFYAGCETVLFVHQLARGVWFRELPFPLGLIGYLAEPLYLRLLRRSRAVVVSESTKGDLLRLGFAPDRVDVIRQGISMAPVVDWDGAQKFDRPTLFCLGSMRPMKRTLHALEAFEILKESVPDLRLILAGDASSRYGRRVEARARASRYADDIDVRGRVDDGGREELMRKCHLLLVPSVREGWGLVVTEANSQGTPAVVYDIPGLRDSVKHGKTGIVCARNSPAGLADASLALLRDRARYETLRKNAWDWSKELTPGNSYRDFAAAVFRP
jgi:glycosyltransferase involved in cell wall biosynthesis